MYLYSVIIQIVLLWIFNLAIVRNNLPLPPRARSPLGQSVSQQGRQAALYDLISHNAWYKRARLNTLSVVNKLESLWKVISLLCSQERDRERWMRRETLLRQAFPSFWFGQYVKIAFTFRGECVWVLPRSMSERVYFPHRLICTHANCIRKHTCAARAAFCAQLYISCRIEFAFYIDTKPSVV